MKKNRDGKTCHRLGVFSAWFTGHYHSELVSGIEMAARRMNTQIIYFIGRPLQSPYPYTDTHNLVYNTALNASLDGLIILSLLANYCDDAALTDFISRFKTIPIITIGIRASISNAILTNYAPGFNALMKHLIHEHHYNKLAFVKGPERNPDTIQCYDIYKSALSAADIPIDPRLVTPGNYKYLSGRKAVKVYLDERGLKPGKDIEVIVCANDTMACGVIDELYNRGLHVPGDIAVTGVDNIRKSFFPKPPLTTVSQHLREIGNKAVYNLLDYKPHQEPLFFDSEIVIRTSCGCPHTTKTTKLIHKLNTKPDSTWDEDSGVHKNDLEFIFHEITRTVENLKEVQKITEFTAWMKNDFPGLGISSAWIFLTSTDSSGVPIYNCVAGYDIRESEEEKLNKKMLENKIFNNLLQKDQNRSFCILPLLSKQEIYGLLAIEINIMTFFVYHTLSYHIGNNIKNIFIEKEMIAMNLRLRQSNEQKTQFFINIAHDTKTPLTMIQNYLEIYLEKHEPDEELVIIKQNIDLLLANMLNFLDVEKLQKGKTIYQHNSLVDLPASAQSKCALFKAMAEIKQIQITLNAESNIVIKIDPMALDRIFNNLLDNAVKYTPEGGEIILDIRNKDGKAMLRISDNGPGLPADTFEHIFEPYYLLSIKKDGMHGMGVGLSIVKKIIDGVGAAISVKKSKEGGLCFTILFERILSIEKKEVLREIPANQLSAPPVQGKIKEKLITPDKFSLLIVDDNIQLLKLMQTALGGVYNIFLARSTAEALIKLKVIRRPDLIISDIMMDGADGFQLLISLAKEEYNDIPFIFLTALGGEKEKIRGLDLGAVDYIEKPFSMAALKAKIESIIALSQRQEQQNLVRLRNSMDKFFSGFDKNIPDSAQFGFENICQKYGIIGREQDIIRMLMRGLVHKEIASFLNITQRAIGYHITKIYKKCNVKNKFDLLKIFQR